MERVQWMSLWDRLRKELETGSTSYGRNQLLALMDRLEREEVRRVEIEIQEPDEDEKVGRGK